MAYRLEDQDEPTREALVALGSAFLAIRAARSLTQRQLEARSGVSQSVISRFENGKAPWLAAVQIARLLAALDLEPGLLGFAEKAVKSPVPGWAVLMQRFEAKRRRLDLLSLEERQRQWREERRERWRLELDNERAELEARGRAPPA